MSSFHNLETLKRDVVWLTQTESDQEQHGEGDAAAGTEHMRCIRMRRDSP